ncbi:hypothetical protein B0H16DRAFT_1459863 [Mycena metata]|uniref:Uncharacterized protein n=1 Tax=Mycena metata TaxID=1033252 RepID=A0AAD7IXY7_9AGAR|nr:hypothetical protein B0H16DRAFT_1459863 [Mycena metata]
MANIVHEIVVPSPTADYVVHEFVATSLSTTPPGLLWREATFTRFLLFANHNHFHSAVNHDARLIFPPATTPDHDNKPRPTIAITHCQLPSGHIQLKGSRIAYTLGINKRAVPSIKVCDSSILAPSLLAITQSESALDQLLPELTSSVARGAQHLCRLAEARDLHRQASKTDVLQGNTLLSQLYCGPITTPFYTQSPLLTLLLFACIRWPTRATCFGAGLMRHWATAAQHTSPAARQSSLVMPPESNKAKTTNGWYRHIDKFVNAGAVGM